VNSSIREMRRGEGSHKWHGMCKHFGVSVLSEVFSGKGQAFQKTEIQRKGGNLLRAGNTLNLEVGEGRRGMARGDGGGRREGPGLLWGEKYT